MINTQELDKILKQIREILIKKNKDYGDTNILELGEKGIAYRISDKKIRLLNLLETNKKPENESIEDTYLDLAGYSIIGLMLRRNKFQKK